MRFVNIKRFNNILLLFLICIAGLISVNPVSLITFAFFIPVTLLAGWIFFKDEEHYTVLFLFATYTILTIIIFWFQYIQFPQNMGATGEGIYGGTDDLYFFQESTRNGVSYRGDRSAAMEHYSLFLQLLAKAVELYKKPQFLDMLFANILAFTFIPIFTRRVAAYLNFEPYAIKFAFFSSAVCPIMIINGLVLVRDGWTAMLLIASIYFVLERRFLLLLLSILFSFYLRISSGAMTLLFSGAILIFADRQELRGYKQVGKVFYIILIIAGTLISIPAINVFMSKTGITGGFFREGIMHFIETSSGEKSAANFIYHLPPVLRLLIAPFFYFGSPFLSLSGLFYNNTVIIRSLIVQLFPFLFIGYFALFIQFCGSFIKLNKTKIISILFFTFIVSIFLLSQLSLQPRHKTMLMPVFYLICAYGLQNKNMNSLYVALTISISLFVFEVVYNFI